MIDFGTLYDVLEKYGWLGVLAFVCIIVIFYIVKNQLSNTNTEINKGLTMFADRISDTMTKQNESLLTNIQDTNKQLIEYIINDKDSTHNKSIDSRLAVEERIDDKLHDMLKEFHANRVAIIEFHNSKENLDGLSFVWYDIHYEKINKGTQEIMMHVQNQPSSILLPVIKALRTDDYVLWSYKELDNMFDSAQILCSQLSKIPDLKYIMYLGIYNADNKLIGLTCIEWHRDIDITQVTEHLFNIKTDVAQIASMLNLKS